MESTQGKAPGFTPGPWIADGYNVLGPVDPRSKHRHGRAIIGGVVDDLNDWRCADQTRLDDRSAFKAETTANLNLLAAAPDLYAALREAESEFDGAARFYRNEMAGFVGASIVARIEACAKKARAALAKAEGRQA